VRDGLVCGAQADRLRADLEELTGKPVRLNMVQEEPTGKPVQVNMTKDPGPPKGRREWK
jgi:hypothetical protein